MKNAHNMSIAIIAILLVLACGTTQQPFSDQVETVVAATLQGISTNTPIDTPANTPSDMPSESLVPTDTPAPTDTPEPTDTPTNTPTPTTAALVVVNVRKLPSSPTPTPEPCGDPCLGSIPSGDYLYIEHAEMISCNAPTLCNSFFSPNDPNYRWSFSPSDDVCLLWVEEGHRADDPTLLVDVYQNNQLRASVSTNVIGDRVCRITDVRVTAPGDYETKLVFGRTEFRLLWSIR